MKPYRIQRHRKKGWRLPPNTLCVSRPSEFGNPFKVATARNRSMLSYRDVVRLFRERFENDAAYCKRVKAKLRGKNLSCFCPLSQPCHADVLLEIANS